MLSNPSAKGKEDCKCQCKERLSNFIWGLGVYLFHLGKRTGLSGPVERAIVKMASRLLAPPSTELDVVLPLGLHMVIPPGFPRARNYASGTYEREVTRLFLGLVQEGMTVVDVGAFCGYYSLLGSRLVGSLGRVYAFEAHPANYSYLMQNLKSNGCPNVMALNQAVSDRGGTLFLSLHEECDHHWLSPSRVGDSVDVAAISLDDFFAQEGWPFVDIIKIDIEGGEKAALEGMRELSRRNPHMQLIMEYDQGNLRLVRTSREELAAVLQELGFRKGYIIERGMKLFSVADGLPRSDATYNLLFRKE